MSSARSVEQWKNFIEGCLDFRPADGVFRIARDIFTEPDLFDLEMELIFEKNWIYACHESEIANKHDFMTMRAGRQPMIITRDGEGQLNALINACQHRGTTLTRVGKGNQSTFTCPFHAWCYKSDGRLVKVKAPGEYPEGFDKATRGLKKARIESYKGFVFISLDVDGQDSLQEFLGDAKVFFDMMVAQSPTGELEVLPGKSAYTYDGNWKLQNENGLDGYHVSTVHYNYVATVQHRQQVNSEKGLTSADTLDYSKLGAGDKETDDGWFAFHNGHSVLFSDMPNPSVRPGYATIGRAEETIEMTKITSTFASMQTSGVKAVHVALLGTLVACFTTNVAANLPTVNLGATSFLDGAPPSGPGLYFTQYLQRYSSHRLLDQAGNRVPLPRTDLRLDVSITQFVYLTNQDILGGKLAFDFLLPWVVDKRIDDGLNNAVLNADRGVGDLTFGPAIQWAPVMGPRGPRYAHRVEFQFLLPTGSYDRLKAINPGSNFWSFNPYWAGTVWMNPNWTTSWRLHYLWNGKNTDPGPSYGPGATSVQAG